MPCVAIMDPVYSVAIALPGTALPDARCSHPFSSPRGSALAGGPLGFYGVDPRAAASIVAISIFCIVIMASIARFAAAAS